MRNGGQLAVSPVWVGSLWRAMFDLGRCADGVLRPRRQAWGVVRCGLACASVRASGAVCRGDVHYPCCLATAVYFCHGGIFLPKERPEVMASGLRWKVRLCDQERIRFLVPFQVSVGRV